MLTKASVATYKYTLDGSTEGNSKQVATSSRELLAVMVTAGSADIVVGIYDSANGGTDPKTAIYIGCNQGESMPFVPLRPIKFEKGIYVQIEQGGSPWNGKLFLSMD